MPKNTHSDGATDRVTLYYRQGGSDKVYQVAVEPQGQGYVVNFAFGRRGSTLQSGTKTPSPVDYADARSLLDKLVAEKTAKGYTPGEDGTPYSHTEHEPRSTGILPQLLNPISQEAAEQFVSDDRWWMQEKFDGQRLLLRRRGTQVTALNRRGLTVGPCQTLAQAVLTLPCPSCLLDGEAVGEVYHAFDLLELDESDVRLETYALRYDRLCRLLDSHSGTDLRCAQTATDAAEKAYMLLRLRERKSEGVVFKDSQAAYTAGRPHTGGPQVKLKFYATCSCLVARANPGRRSVALELIEGSAGEGRVAVGSVTVPPNRPVPRAGQVVKVRYLYAYPGGSLYQPLYLGVRDDVIPAACGMWQLKYRREGHDEE